ncbi:MAG: Gfo/Idh/MocA family oxidoreductase [Bacteroidales bacterium]|jgi:predicted dehydrogenase|nr:Gfo/Idh/MocA family oxidoreductase [Bacteroidales bacterium]
MKINLIIGAGQLGSRHLQGLLKYAEPQKIYVLDPSKTSLEIASQRAKEIIHTHELQFRTNWYGLPDSFDLVIIATNSDVREKIINQLLTNHHVSNLILEKVLFQELASFKRIAKLIEENQVSTWVNHPRRLFDSYIKLKQKLKTESPKVYQITGGNWGLGCNGLHFIDLILFLSGSTLLSLDAEWIDAEVLESKRKGFVEFTGTIKGRLHDGSIFFITSLQGHPSAITLTVFDANDRYFVQEGGTPKIYNMANNHEFKLEESSFTLEYQSNLTTTIIDQLLKTGNCGLPTFMEATNPHKLFISALLDKYNSITGNTTKKLPIT